jgi:N-methylhydantoinase B
VTALGVVVPVSFGQLGGWPGVCNRQMVIRGTRVFPLWAEGELPLELRDVLAPLDLDRLGGELELLEAKVGEFELVPGDVVQYTWQGGGGYGDPLDRDEELVRRDVELGLISPARAESVYSVPGDRTARRLERLSGSEPQSGSSGGSGAPVSEIGLGLVLARGGEGGLQIECRCGFVFCAASANWREHAVRQRVDELPRGIVVHETLELARYLCPACGRQHSVDVEERGEPPLHDFSIVGDWAP